MRIATALLALAVSAPALSTPAWADCPLDLGRGTGLVVFSSHYLLAFRAEPLRIEVGEPFSLLVNACTRSDKPAELLRRRRPHAGPPPRHELPAHAEPAA